MSSTRSSRAKRGSVPLAAVSAYCNDTVTRDMPATVVRFGAMRPDAVLTALPEAKKAGTRGRTSQRGAPLPKPQDLAKDAAHPWQRCKAMLCGRLTEVREKMLDAQWYRACGTRLLRIVIVATERGTIPIWGFAPLHEGETRVREK